MRTSWLKNVLFPHSGWRVLTFNEVNMSCICGVMTSSRQEASKRFMIHGSLASPARGATQRGPRSCSENGLVMSDSTWPSPSSPLTIIDKTSLGWRRLQVSVLRSTSTITSMTITRGRGRFRTWVKTQRGDTDVKRARNGRHTSTYLITHILLLIMRLVKEGEGQTERE